MSEAPFLRTTHILTLESTDEKMKQFDLDMSKGATSNVDIVPPPSLSHVDLPFKYRSVLHR